MYTNFLSGNLKGSDHSEDLKIDGRIILEQILNKIRWRVVEVNLIWPRIGASGGHL
jgi:hypothetical protein